MPNQNTRDLNQSDITENRLRILCVIVQQKKKEIYKKVVYY